MSAFLFLVALCTSIIGSICGIGVCFYNIFRFSRLL